MIEVFMARFLGDISFTVLGKRQLAKPTLKYELEQINLPEGIMILDIEGPLEEKSKVFHTLLVSLDIRTDSEFDTNYLIKYLKRKIKNSVIIVRDIQILGEVHE